MDYELEKLPRGLKLVSGKREADAAVALLLKETDGELEILLVERVENPVDPWSGQMAFPGGKRDSQDENLMQTVVRETLEEVHINLLDRCHFLGVMTTFTSSQRPEMKVLPFVFVLHHEPTIKLNRRELKGFIWIPLKELFQSEGSVRFEFGEFPAYVVGNNVIWGLTYRILKNLQLLLNRGI